MSLFCFAKNLLNTIVTFCYRKLFYHANLLKNNSIMPINNTEQKMCLELFKVTGTINNDVIY